MKKSLILICLIILFSLPRELCGFENEKTHPALTGEAIGVSVTDAYLKTQLGLDNGMATDLYWDFPSDIKERINGGDADPDETTRSILEWIRTGSTIEDEDGYWRLFNF